MLHALPLLLAISGQAAVQQTAPPPPAHSVPAPAQAAAPVRRVPPPPYDEKADAAKAIDTAVTAAAVDDVRVLINWGANDDAGTAAYTKARSAPEVARATPNFFADEYKVVNVNVGHLDANLALAKQYGAKLIAGSLPALTVLDAKGKVLANTNSASLRPADAPAGVDASKLAMFLTSHEAPAPDANATFEAAVKEAKTTGKTAFVWFSAPWCGWCHRLGAWMATKDVAPLLNKEFVFAKLDYDRGIGAKDIEKRYIDGEQGLPWIVFLDGDARAMISGTRPDPKLGNIGHPNEPDEVAYFKTMLETVKKHLTDADITYLIDSLVAFNKVANGK